MLIRANIKGLYDFPYRPCSLTKNLRVLPSW